MTGNGNPTTHKIKAKTYTLLLCDRGRELRDRWTGLLGKNADADEIFTAMHDYFIHKNGMRNHFGEMVIAACPHCRMISGGPVDQFARVRDGNSGR